MGDYQIIVKTMPTLNFKGKTFVQNHHLAVKYHQLIPDKEKSLGDKVSLHDNLIIHGDNLKALKALLPTYAGRIKCIYIDPPYNTGKEDWIYNDNVRSPMLQEWLGKVVAPQYSGSCATPIPIVYPTESLSHIHREKFVNPSHQL